MLILARFVGILMIIIGVIFFFSPSLMKRYIAFWWEGKRPYVMGILRLLIGIIFLLAASQSKQVAVMVVLGVLTLIGGVIIFILGLEKVKTVLDWWYNSSLLALRFLALLAIALGVLITYSV